MPGIFGRCGLNYLAVEAESGPIGGDARLAVNAVYTNRSTTYVIMELFGLIVLMVSVPPVP